MYYKQQFFLTNKLQSKKGFIITGIVLAAITAGSFAIWFVPQDSQTKFVISNPKNELDALIEQQKTIADSDKVEFDKMIAGQITHENYIAIAEISSSQINSMIISIIESDVSQEWHESYAAFGNYLRSYNTYLRETIVIAEKLKADPTADVTEEISKLDQYLSDAQTFLAESNSARPA